MKMEINYMKEILKMVIEMEKELDIMKMEINYMKVILKIVNTKEKE